MAYWFEVMAEIKDRPYAEQIAYLRENHGFSQAHANALVMASRGSVSARRFTSVDQYLAQFDQTKQRTVRAILASITGSYPQAEVVIAWNKPMVRLEGRYVFGVSVHTGHILIAPMTAGVIDAVRPRLAGYVVNKKTIRVPVDWTVDDALLREVAVAELDRADD